MTGDQMACGFFDGFEAYATPTDEDLRSVLTTGLVALDANALLDFYRVNDQTREDLFRALGRIESQLWVPNQAVEEFWRNREATLRNPHDVDDTVANLGKHHDAARQTFKTWANRVSLAQAAVDEVFAALERGFATATDAVASVAATAKPPGHDTNNDDVVARLDTLLTGRVGPAFDAETADRCRHEAAVRAERGVPPGFKDAKKDNGGHGDYFVWEQLLREAGRRACDVLFVTSETKPDWWRIESKNLRGPRMELVREMRTRGGGRFFMTSPGGLLDLAHRLLQVDVRPASVADANRVRVKEAVAELPVEEQRFVLGWSVNALRLLRKYLLWEGWTPQVDVIHAAAVNGGFVSRQEVYEIAEYGERSLKGFTRPVRRITQMLVADGQIPSEAVDVLTATYGDGPGKADGVSVPVELAELVLEAWE